MRVTLLGTGTPAPSLVRQGSGYLVEVGADTLVLDHGPGAHYRLLESGRHATDVTHALFSHLHYDHCLDYARLVLQRWDQGAGRIPELQVYGPAPIARMTELLFADDGVWGPDLDARTGHPSSMDVYGERGGVPPRSRPQPVVTEIRAGIVINGGDWTVTVGTATHVEPWLECLCYRIDSAAGSVCYSGDSSPTDALAELAKECDVLIQMNHFLTGKAPSSDFAAACGHHLGNAEMAQRAGVKMLVLTHLPPALDAPEVHDRMLAEIRAVYDGRVLIGADLMELTVGR